MTLKAAVVCVSVLAGVAVLVIIPVLALLYYRKHRQVTRLQHQLDTQTSQLTNKITSMSGTQVNSLPCRLKKKPSSAGGSRSAAGESGVYDMAEISQLPESSGKQAPVTATYTNPDGDPHRLYFYGDISADDSLAVKQVISHHIQYLHGPAISCRQTAAATRQSNMSTVESLSVPELEPVRRLSRMSLSLDDIIISGLDTSSLSYENEGYRRDDFEHMNGSSKRRQQVKKTISALSNRMRINIRRDEKLSSKLSESVYSSPYTTYKSAIIGQSGGDMLLNGGVKLSVPAHALSEKVQIILGITFDPKHIPQLSEEEALLTPIIFCEPSGLEFKHPAVLSIPHCAVQVQENWRVNIHSSQSDIDSSEATEWKILQIGDYESRAFNKQEVQLCVNHFTMYCVSGSSKVKRAACKRKKLIALATEPSSNTYSIYCVNSYHPKTNQQTTLAETTQSALILESSGSAIQLSVEGLTSDWAYTMSSEQQISYDDGWHDYLHPITLSLQPKEQAEDMFCELCSWQTGASSSKYKLSLPCANTLQTRSGSRTAVGRKRSVFSETLSWDLRLLLDPVHADGSDWRKLSQELGLSSDTIKTMEDTPSPTKELLRVWEECSHGCIKSFVAMAVKIGRLDVAERIEEHVGKLYLETLPNHKCNDHC